MPDMPMSADAVLSRLEATLFRAPAHAMLREVRNATGFARVTRTADALVVSLWPSRGVWFAGVEVKVSRGDWLRELKDPAKSDEIQRFCNYWWVATPPGIVRDGELPAAWGLVEVTSAKSRVKKAAPKLKPAPLSAAFVAAVFRNRAEYEAGLRGRIVDELRMQQMNDGTPVADTAYLIAERERAVHALEDLRGTHQKLLENVAQFEQDAGVRVRDPWSRGNHGKAFALARRIMNEELNNEADKLEEVARELRELQQGLANKGGAAA